MNYQNNFDGQQGELQAALSALKGTHFSKYDVYTHATFLTVEAYGTSIDIRAEFEIRFTSADLIDERGDLYKQAHLRIEVRSQPWSAKSLNELIGIQELIQQVYQVVEELRAKFGTQDVYVLVTTKEDQGRAAQRASQTELTNLVQEHVKGMRLGGAKFVSHHCLSASKAKVLPDTYTTQLGPRIYTVEVDEKKNLNISRIE